MDVNAAVFKLVAEASACGLCVLRVVDDVGSNPHPMSLLDYPHPRLSTCYPISPDCRETVPANQE